MYKLYTKKLFLHTLGVFLIALGMALDSIHGIGDHPMKQFTIFLSYIVHGNKWITFFLLCIVFDLLYYIKTKKLEVVFTIIETIVLIFLAIALKNNLAIPMHDYVDTLILQFLVLIISLIITSIGIVILFKSHLSMFAIEQAIVLIKGLKPFKKFNISKARMVVDAIFFVLAVLLCIIYLPTKGFADYWGSLVIVILGGPCLHVCFLIYDHIFPRKETHHHSPLPISFKVDCPIEEREREKRQLKRQIKKHLKRQETQEKSNQKKEG